MGWGEAIAGGATEGLKRVARSYPSAWLGAMRGLKTDIRQSLKDSGYGEDEIAAHLDQGKTLPPEEPAGQGIERALDLPGTLARNLARRLGITKGLHDWAAEQEKRTLQNSALADPRMAPNEDFQRRLAEAGGAKQVLGDLAG